MPALTFAAFRGALREANPVRVPAVSARLRAVGPRRVHPHASLPRRPSGDGRLPRDALLCRGGRRCLPRGNAAGGSRPARVLGHTGPGDLVPRGHTEPSPGIPRSLSPPGRELLRPVALRGNGWAPPGRRLRDRVGREPGGDLRSSARLHVSRPPHPASVASYLSRSRRHRAREGVARAQTTALLARKVPVLPASAC